MMFQALFQCCLVPVQNPIHFHCPQSYTIGNAEEELKKVDIFMEHSDSEFRDGTEDG